MSLGLETLFEYEGFRVLSASATPSIFEETRSSNCSALKAVTKLGSLGAVSNGATDNDNDGLRGHGEQSKGDQGAESDTGDLNGLDDLFGGVQLMLEGKMDGLAEGRIEELTKERDELKAQVKNQVSRINVLEKRLASAAATVDGDLVVRLKLLEQENRRMESAMANFKEDLQEAKRANNLLCDDNEGKSRKLRGANKKVKNAKDVAAKEEEKAKAAKNEKNDRLKHEQQMRKELKAAQSEVSKKDKIIEGLRADLHIEQAGYPHLRADGTLGDEATVAFSVQFTILRAHFQRLRFKLEHCQTQMTDQLKQEYARLRKPQEEKRIVVGATYVDAPATRMGIDLNEDVIDMPQTGAEHDSRRSRRGLEAISRRVMIAHNSFT